MKRLAGKRVLLTGAGSGMGRVCAGMFAEEGARLFLSDVNSDALESTAADLRTKDAAIGGVAVADVSESGEVMRLVKKANMAMNGLDAGVHWAGVVDEPAQLHETSIESWKRVIGVNLTGTFYFTRAIVPLLALTRGSLVLISSVAGMVGWPSHPAYCASKGGVLMLGRAVGIEYASSGVRINCLCPGSANTPMLEQILRDARATRDDLLELEPSGRFGDPEELCRGALFLVSDEGSYMNGSAMVIDGGMTAA